MKVKVKVIATGEVIEAEPNYYDGEIVSWTEEIESDEVRMYRPEEVEVEQQPQPPKLYYWEGSFDSQITFSRYDWDAIRISAAQSALQGCIISGKPNPVQSAMKYSAELVEALRKELE